MPWPVPRGLAVPAAFLAVVQTAALTSIAPDGEVIVGAGSTENRVDTAADVIGVFAVPALTAVLVVVIFSYLARANADVVKASLRHRQRHAHGLGGGGRAGLLHHGQLHGRESH